MKHTKTTLRRDHPRAPQSPLPTDPPVFARSPCVRARPSHRSLIALSARGQTNYKGASSFNTFAGNAFGGNRTGNQAIFDNPYATAVDGAGNVYVADTYNYTVRKITPAGVVTIAGLADNDGSTDGTGSAARFGPCTGW